MLKGMKVREECLYCHGQIKLGNRCPVCGDVKLAESLRPPPSPRSIPMFHHPGARFEPKIAGV